MRVAVLMLNLGGPACPADVRPFLRNLFADRETIRFPGGRLGQWLFSRALSLGRAPFAARNYRRIGGGSPLLSWTEKQAEGMRRRVEQALGIELLALPCMRYWHPFTEEALARAAAWGAERIVAFSQYPQFSSTTTGNSLAELHRVAARMRLEVPISEIRSWHDEKDYVGALAECVREGVAGLPEQVRSDALVLYSAHSLPLRVVEAGDPYPEQVRATVRLVQEASGLELPHELAWQSRVGPMAWLGPSTLERTSALPGEGHRHVVIVPVSFTSDHIETLYELDLLVGAAARRAGMESFVRAPSLNARPSFLDALAEILRAHLASLGLGECRSAS